MAIAGEGMSIITVKKADLLEALQKNAVKHAADYTEALQGYHESVVEQLEKALNDARAGSEYKTGFNLPEPQDHSAQYNRIIRMLQMAVTEEIKITDHEFSQYVLDEWNWKDHFIATASSYSNKR